MATTCSNEAVQGSVGAGSEPQPAAAPAHAGVHAPNYTQDSAAPVNVILASPLTSQSVTYRDHGELLGSIDNLFGGQHQTTGPAAAAPPTTGTGVVQSGSENGPSSIDIALRGVGAHFGMTQSTSAGRSAGRSTGAVGTGRIDSASEAETIRAQAKVRSRGGSR
ncbi:hypothetical protein F5Y06DRAFT_296442 [Hypoxylon sp. FL0890]|nr:hypothetical protein F5Y06DRAFT_296442 [Hypoxylon sp. FL0890]